MRWPHGILQLESEAHVSPSPCLPPPTPAETNSEMHTSADKWPGVAGILQVVCILGSGLTLFVSRGGEDDGMGYSGF